MPVTSWLGCQLVKTYCRTKAGIGASESGYVGGGSTLITIIRLTNCMRSADTCCGTRATNEHRVEQYSHKATRAVPPLLLRPPRRCASPGR